MKKKTLDEVIALCGALSNRHRLSIIAALVSGKEKKKYTISELARELEISRPLLYLHLQKLEEVGLLKGKTELGKGNRARRYYELCDFELCLNGKKIKEMLETEGKIDCLINRGCHNRRSDALTTPTRKQIHVCTSITVAKKTSFIV